MLKQFLAALRCRYCEWKRERKITRILARGVELRRW